MLFSIFISMFINEKHLKFSFDLFSQVIKVIFILQSVLIGFHCLFTGVVGICTRLCILAGVIAHKLTEKKVEIDKIRRLSYVAIYHEGYMGNSRGTKRISSILILCTHLSHPYCVMGTGINKSFKGIVEVEYHEFVMDIVCLFEGTFFYCFTTQPSPLHCIQPRPQYH